MNPGDVNLNSILARERPNFSELLARTIEESSMLASVAAPLLSAAAGQRWSAQVACSAQDNLGELLNVDMRDVLIGAWNESVVLRRYLDSQRYPPDQTVVAHLSEHSIRSEHRPYVEISVGSLSERLEFGLLLELKLKGFRLKIRGGQIHEILNGDCQGKAKLSCGPALLWETETGTLFLPGSIKLEPPRKIVG